MSRIHSRAGNLRCYIDSRYRSLVSRLSEIPNDRTTAAISDNDVSSERDLWWRVTVIEARLIVSMCVRGVLNRPRDSGFGTGDWVLAKKPSSRRKTALAESPHYQTLGSVIPHR